jgi:outer membrane protein assembly factor BamB
VKRLRGTAIVALLVPALVVACGDSQPPPQATGTDTSTATVAPPPPPAATSHDWTRFGYDAARTNNAPVATRITAANVGALERHQIRLPGTVDSSPIYLHDVRVAGRSRDVFFVTTTYGRTLALDAASGEILWMYVPPGVERWEGSSQITNASPVASSDRRFLYTVSPDGRIHKLRVANGREVTAGAWPVSVTRDPTHEKIAPALNLARGLVLVATGGYIGDAPPYQGHVAAIDAESGELVNVFSALCSDRRGLIDPPTCPESGSAIWARAGVVVEPGSGRLLAVTGNGAWNGRTNWGDSVLELTFDASRLVGSFTPTNQAELEATDADLGSTAPALLGHGLALQGGKEAIFRLLDLRRLAPAGRQGGEVQRLDAPGGANVFTAPAVVRANGRTRVFAATFSGTAAYELRGRSLRVLWENDRPGTSPVVAGGLVFVYDPSGGGLNVYRPGSGEPVATLPAGDGHWNSPIVADGRIALPEGDANDHATSGVLDIYRLP